MAKPTSNGIGLPPSVNLGDMDVGAQSIVDVPIFNLDQGAESYLSVRLEGDPEIVLVSNPQRLWPSGKGFDPADSIRFAFQPKREGSFATKATISMSWQGSTRAPQTLVVPVTAYAHVKGSPTWQERVDEATAEITHQTEVLKEQAHAHEIEQADIRLENDHHTHTGSGADTVFDKRQQDLRAAYRFLFNQRRTGVTRARDEAKGYARQPKHDDASLRRLAMLGIDVATVLISGGVAEAAELALEHVIGSKLLAGALAEGAKRSVEIVGEKASARLEPSKPGESDRPRAEFFQQEESRLNDSDYAASVAVGDVTTVLFPIRAKDPHAADVALQKMTDAVMQEGTSAVGKQANQSREHWVQYVAHESMGGQPDHEHLTNIAKANQVPDQSGPRSHFDGLLDVKFTASLDRPHEPVQVASARITGIKQDIVAELATRSLLDTRIPVRAIGVPSHNAAVTPITVVRDEAGHLAYSEEVGIESQPAHWLERKGGDGNARTGARRLLEELLTAPLGDKLFSDDTSPANKKGE